VVALAVRLLDKTGIVRGAAMPLPAVLVQPVTVCVTV